MDHKLNRQVIELIRKGGETAQSKCGSYSCCNSHKSDYDDGARFGYQLGFDDALKAERVIGLRQWCYCVTCDSRLVMEKCDHCYSKTIGVREIKIT